MLALQGSPGVKSHAGGLVIVPNVMQSVVGHAGGVLQLYNTRLTGGQHQRGSVAFFPGLSTALVGQRLGA